MLNITFGKIEAGWADTTFDFGHASIVLSISYVCDPFTELAEFGLRVLKNETPLEVEFNDEQNYYTLVYELAEGRNEVMLKIDDEVQTTDSGMLSTEADPREFATKPKPGGTELPV